MATFQYIAKDAAGNETRGVVEAGDRQSAIEAVRAQGLRPTAMGEVRSSAPAKKARRGAPAPEPAEGGKKKGRSKAGRVLGMTAEEGMRSVAVVTAMEKSVQFVPPEQPPPPKWQPVVMPTLEFPKVTELTKAWLR